MPAIDVKQAVAAVRQFATEVLGPQSTQYARVEEVELKDAEKQWQVTMSFSSPTGIVFGQEGKEYKTFRVDAQTGTVISMKIRE